MNYNKIFLAHCKTKQPLMLWGSSGYGKSSIISEFANMFDLELKVLHAQYLDPLSLFIPSTTTMQQNGYAKMYPTEVIYDILNTKKNTLLFLDELTRAREDTLNVLTEIFLERKIFGFKIPKNVYIFAASNFSDEDIGVNELPDAVMKRMTHIIFTPHGAESIKNMRSPLAKSVLEKTPEILAKPFRPAILNTLSPCPRQIDACAKMAEKGLSGEELIEVCRGRVGVEKGTELAFSIINHLQLNSLPLPQVLTQNEFKTLELIEQKGSVMEIIEYLTKQMAHFERHQAIAEYLLLYAGPEVCRSMQLHKFQYQIRELPKYPSGELLSYINHTSQNQIIFDKVGKPWQWYAAKIGKLASR